MIIHPSSNRIPTLRGLIGYAIVRDTRTFSRANYSLLVLMTPLINTPHSSLYSLGEESIGSHLFYAPHLGHLPIASTRLFNKGTV